MNRKASIELGMPTRSKDQELVFECSAALGALLDHIAEELATEFVRLMRASAPPEPEEGRSVEKL